MYVCATLWSATHMQVALASADRGNQQRQCKNHFLQENGMFAMSPTERERECKAASMPSVLTDLFPFPAAKAQNFRVPFFKSIYASLQKKYRHKCVCASCVYAFECAYGHTCVSESVSHSAMQPHKGMRAESVH